MAVAEHNPKPLLSYFDYEKLEFLSYQVLIFSDKINVLPRNLGEPTPCVIKWVLDPTHRSTQLRERKEQDCLFWWELALLLT